MNPQLHKHPSYAKGDRAQISKRISDEDVLSFAKVTGDFNPLHMDSEYARRTRFKGRIVHGMLGASLISAVLGTKLPGPGSIYLSQDLQFVRPVRIGDTLTAEVEVTSWDASRRLLGLATRCYNQSGEDVITGDAKLLVEPPGARVRGQIGSIYAVACGST